VNPPTSAPDQRPGAPSRGFLALSLAAIAATLIPAPAPARAQEILQRERPRDWTLTVNIRLRAWQERIGRIAQQPDRVPDIRTFEFDSAQLVFPALTDTASSIIDGEVSGDVRIENDVIDDEPSIIPKTYHSGTRLARWDLGQTRAKTVTLEVKIPTTCFKTVFDEQAARDIDWPTGDYPPVSRSTFQPQSFIDVGPDGQPYDMTYVDKLLKHWTNGKDPKSIPPVTLAKFLAGQVVEYFQPSGHGLSFSRSAMLEGIDLAGAAIAAREARGSEFDMVTLYIALLRQAGLPARMVIGWDKGEEDEHFLESSTGSRQNLRAWTEFFLYDEQSNNGWWIPVDVVKIRKGRSRMPSGYLDRPLPYFGTHKDLDKIVPFSFHFHPPTSVVAYGTPGFWGWNVFPRPPESAFQEIRFSVIATPVTPERQREKRERRRP